MLGWFWLRNWSITVAWASWCRDYNKILPLSILTKYVDVRELAAVSVGSVASLFPSVGQILFIVDSLQAEIKGLMINLS